MGREEQIIKERERKLGKLIKQKLNPYKNKYNIKDHAIDILKKYSKLKPEEKTKDKVSIAGRVMAIRDIGKIAFVVLQDSTARILEI